MISNRNNSQTYNQLSNGTALAIKHLPVELLSMIFRLVPDEDPPSLYFKDIITPAGFPYALASVCKAWRDVMLSLPHFWTHLVVFIGPSNPTSPPDLHSQLTASRNLPIDVHFIWRMEDWVAYEELDRESDLYMHTAREERQRTSALVDILKPHLRRCEGLYIRTLDRSSLPSICDDIGGIPDIQHLTLQSRNGGDEGDNVGMDMSVPGPASKLDTPFEFPKLESLTIDGPNFVRACRQSPDWLVNQWLIPDEAATATSTTYTDIGNLEVHVAHLSVTEGEILGFTLYDALKALRNVGCLYLTDTEFTIEPGKHRPGSFELGMLEELMLTDLSGDLIREFLRVSALRELSVLDITACPLEAFEAPVHTAIITLADLDDSEGLACFLRKWTGSFLRLESCVGFDDRLIDELCYAITLAEGQDLGGGGGGGGGNGNVRPLGNMVELKIENCTNFSVARLKHFIYVLTRGRPPSIRLEVEGLPALSDEDRFWFITNTASYRWSLD